MAQTSETKTETTLTTAQALGSLIKSARDILRKDKGLNGDLDRLPLLTWVMFLKFLDDLETQREEEAALAGLEFKAALEPPYRWRDWAARADGITGDELLSFINSECVRRMVLAVLVSSRTYVHSRVPTGTTGAMLWQPCSGAWTTA